MKPNVVFFFCASIVQAVSCFSQSNQNRLMQKSIGVDAQHLNLLTSNAISNNSQLKINEVGLRKIEIEKRTTSADHLGLLSLSGNMNEFNIQDLSGNSSAPSFFPRYNLGISLRFNHFAEVKGKKRSLDEDKKIIHHESELIKKEIEKTTLELYINYLKQKGNYAIQKSLESFSSLDFEAIEQKFSDGLIELEVYNQARKDLYLNRASLIDAESEFLLSRFELEKYVGQTLLELGIDQ